MLYKHYGIIYATMLLVSACMFSTVGLLIYARCNHKMNDRSKNIANFCEITFPELRKVVEFAIFFKCFGVATSYLIIVRDTISILLYDAFPYEIFKNQKVGLLLFLLIIGPFTYHDELNKLVYTSFIGVTAIVFVIGSAIYRLFTLDLAPTRELVLTKPINISFITGLGTFVFAFTCHQNLITIQNEIRANEYPKIKKLVISIMGTALLVYLIFGGVNYYMFGDNLKDNVLMNYPDDPLTKLMKIFYVFVMAFSYPLQVNPCRKYFYSLMNLTSDMAKNSMALHIIINTTILVLTYLLTARGLNLGRVYTFIGASASSFICLVLPPLFSVKMGLYKSKREVFFGSLMFVLGISVFLTMVYDNLMAAS